MITITFDKSCRDIIIPFQRKSIRELFYKNFELFNISYPIKINLSVERDDDNHDWMAKFLIEKSSKHKFHIAFNAFWLEGFAPRNNRQLSIVNRTILHEIIHGLDILTIEDSHKKHRTNYHSVRLLLVQEKSDFFWALMYFFTLLRDEGIALYGESLLLGSDSEKTNEELNEMLASDVEWMLSAMEQNQAERANLDEVFSRVYEYGAYIYNELFLEERKGKIASEHLLDLMKMDVSHWIWLFFKRLFPHQVHRLLIHYSNQKILWFGMLVPPNPTAFDDPKGLLIDYFQECSIKPLDQDMFKVIRHRLVENMPTASSEWETERYEHDLHLMVHQRLVRIWDQLDEELQRYSLSYFATLQDQLHDELTFIGHLDDMLLLDYLEEYCC